MSPLAGARAVYFDAVGTLLFPAEPPAATYAAAARRQGVHPDPTLIRSRFLAAFAAEEAADRTAGWVTDEARERDRWRRIVAASLPELPNPALGFGELWEHFARPEAWVVNPDAEAVFAELTSRGLVVGIGSNLDARLTRVVAGHPVLAPVVGRVVVSAAVGHRKPSPRFFDAMVRSAGTDAGTIVFVGDDAENDYRGATAAGMHAVRFCGDDSEPTDARIGRLGQLVDARN